MSTVLNIVLIQYKFVKLFHDNMKGSVCYIIMRTYGGRPSCKNPWLACAYDLVITVLGMQLCAL